MARWDRRGASTTDEPRRRNGGSEGAEPGGGGISIERDDHRMLGSKRDGVSLEGEGQSGDKSMRTVGPGQTGGSPQRSLGRRQSARVTVPHAVSMCSPCLHVAQGWGAMVHVRQSAESVGREAASVRLTRQAATRWALSPLQRMAWRTQNDKRKATQKWALANGNGERLE